MKYTSQKEFDKTVVRIYFVLLLCMISIIYLIIRISL